MPKPADNAVAKVFLFIFHLVMTPIAVLTFLVDLTIGNLLSFVAMAIQVPLYSLPVVGRLILMAVSWVYFALFFVVNLFDFLWTLAGFMPTKQMRLAVVILEDDQGNHTSDADVRAAIQKTIDVFWEYARIRVIPVKWVSFHIPFFGKPDIDPAEYVLGPSKSSRACTHLSGEGLATFGEDLLMTGVTFNWIMTTRSIPGNFRRLIGYGAPVTIFSVPSIANAAGFSMGGGTDYVTAEYTGHSNHSTFAHEVGHACGLLHDSDPPNLMTTPSRTDSQLKYWQAAIVRSSRHVTFF